MKKTVKSSMVTFLMAVGALLLFSTEPATAQNANQNQKKQRFSQMDQNRDGKISQNEYRYGQFGQFDRNNDGVLSRNEFRQMNKVQKRTKDGTGNAVKQQKRLRDGTGAGQQRMKGQGNNFGRGQGMHRGAGTGSRRGRG